jgi:cytochrome c-type biogenesis protein CcmE
LWYVIGGVLVLAFIAYGATSFKSNLTPYVSFEEAQRTGSKVQVAGALVEESTEYLEDEQLLEFEISDESGNVLKVKYAGIKPGNFEEATQIVAVGSYENGIFECDQLLVKCQSKYQGLEEA